MKSPVDSSPSTYTNELKDIAGFLGFKWSSHGLAGHPTILQRQKWDVSSDEKHKTTLVRYNIEDCEALKVTKDWLAEVGCKDAPADVERVAERRGSLDVNRVDKRLGVPDKCPNCGMPHIISASKVLRRRRVLDLPS